MGVLAMPYPGGGHKHHFLVLEIMIFNSSKLPSVHFFFSLYLMGHGLRRFVRTWLKSDISRHFNKE